MSDWSVLGRSGDPVPGDPVRVRGLAGRVLANAGLVERNTAKLRDIAASGGDLALRGSFAPGMLQALGELPDELAKLGRAYRGCGDALQAFAGDLDHAKSVARDALRRGIDAHGDVQTQQSRIRSQAPAIAAELTQPRVFMDTDHTNRLLAQITDATVQQSVHSAVITARSAESRRRQAAALADQAAELHRGAESRASQRINDALDSSGIRNKSWWEKAWDFVTWPFQSWDNFVTTLNVIVAVLAVIALFVSGPFLAIILVLSVIILVITAIQAMNGNASWWDVGLQLLFLIPGARFAGSLRWVGTALRNTRVFGALRGVTRFAGAVRSGLGQAVLRGRSMLSRVLGLDPVDLATGEMVMTETDVILPAASMPLAVSRTYTTSFREGRLFGPAWSSPLDQRLEIDVSGVYYASFDGMAQRFPLPESEEPVFADEGERVALRMLPDGTFTVTDPQTGETRHFAEVPGAVLGMHNLVRVVDRNGNTVSLEYDERAVLRTVRHYGGYVVDVITDRGLATELRLRGTDREPDQVLVRYDYDAAGLLVGVTNSSGRPLALGYDEHGRVVSWTDRNGVRYRYSYDSRGRVVATQGSEGIFNGTIAYDDASRTTVETNSLGHATTYHFNERYQLTRVVDPLGHATTTRWDRFNRLLSVTDALGHTTSYSYDETGNLTRVDQPDGTHAMAAYSALNRPVRVVDPSGAAWRYDYDERGNLVSATDPARNRTEVGLDAQGMIVTLTDAAGQVTRLVNNSAGLPLGITDQAGATTSCVRDALGRVVAVTDPLGGTTWLTWTLEGKLTSTTVPDGATERWAYDAEGNLVEHVSAAGAVTRYEISGFDQVAVRTGPDGGRMSFSYDTETRLLAVTNPQGLVWRFEHDPAGRLVGEIDFNGRAVTYRRDAAGRLIARTNALGQTVRYRHDAMGRVVESSADGEATAFRYDPVGRLVAATGPGADLRIERDELGRVVAEAVNGRLVRSQYDVLGRRVARTTPSGLRTEWSYDANGVPSSMRVGGQIVHFRHDGLGREVARVVGQVTIDQAWDPSSRLAAQTVTGPHGTLLQHRAFTYRPDGHPVALHDHLAGTRQFDLDSQGRITAVGHGGDWAEQYRYDAAGNLTQAAWPAATQDEAEPVGAREYAGTRVRTAGRVRFEHDAQGRVTLRQRKVASARPLTWRYTWNAYDQLVQVATPDGTQWTYEYDPLGRRIAKTRLGGDGAPVQRVDFTWDGRNLAERSGADGRVTAWDYEPGTSRPLSQTERALGPDASQQAYDERFFAIVTDIVGTPTELVDTEGTLSWRMQPAVWGAAQPVLAGVDCPLRFPGQYHDDESGLNYNVFRYYDRDSARYVSNDPIGLFGGDDPHAYVHNPLSSLDPLGLAPRCAWAATRAWQAMRVQIDSHTFLLTRERLVHMLERHHPDFFRGPATQLQTFFDSKMTISGIEDAIKSVMSQNRDTLLAAGTNAAPFQIQGTVDGIDYIVGLTRGKIGQFFPLP